MELGLSDEEFLGYTERELWLLREAWVQKEKRTERRFAHLASILFNSNQEPKDRKPFQFFMLHFPDKPTPKQLPNFEDYLRERKRQLQCQPPPKTSQPSP